MQYSWSGRVATLGSYVGTLENLKEKCFSLDVMYIDMLVDAWNNEGLITKYIDLEKSPIPLNKYA